MLGFIQLEMEWLRTFQAKPSTYESTRTKTQTHLYSEGAGVSRPLRKVPSISAASESMGRTEASEVYRCTVLLGRLLFLKFLMSSRASQSMSSHCEYLSRRSLSCRQGETYLLNCSTRRIHSNIHNARTEYPHIKA